MAFDFNRRIPGAGVLPNSMLPTAAGRQVFGGAPENTQMAGEEAVSQMPSVSGNTLSGGLQSYTNVAPGAPTQGTGSLVDFQKVMRSVSEDAYEYRQGKEKKVTGKQFDADKVSGSIFRSIMENVESARGGAVSKVYEGAVEAAKFDITERERVRQNNIEQENKKFDLIKQKTELGIDSIYIPSGTLADRNNNPGNLRFVGQTGATMGEGGFAKFNSPEDGYQALINQIALDQSRGLTLEQFVNKYAPPSENNTGLYVQQMSQWLGVSPQMQLSNIDIDLLAENVAKKESGTQKVSATEGSMQAGIDALAKKYKSGEITAAQIPAAQRGKVISAAENLGQTVSPEQKTVLMQNVSIVDKILNDDNYKAISGFAGGMTGSIPFTEGRQTAKTYDQLKGLLSLDKRQMLKGQGAISDFEFKILESAAANISRWSSEEDFKKSLIEIRGAFQTAAGDKANVKVSKGGQSKTGKLSRQEITDAVSQGYIVEYI